MFTPIKPCPFCASRDVVVSPLGTQVRPFFAVECGECEATGPLSRSYDGAVDMWNFRAKPDGDGQ
jgi:Lar family restriction alleviation protein